MGLKIYGAPISPFVRKVRVFLEEKGVEYALDPVNPFSPPDGFLEISPLKRIPVLRDEDVGREGVRGTIPDSSAICAYLERKLPAPALYPAGDYDFARALWYEEYADSDLASTIGVGVFQPLVLKRFFGQEPDLDKARQTMEKKLPPYLDYLEGELRERTHFVGDSFGIADISVATQFVNLAHAGQELDASRWPNLCAFVERVHGRPSFAKCIAEEQAILAPLKAS